MSDSLELEPDKMKGLRTVLEELDLEYREIFSNDFMADNTPFTTIDEMLEAGKFLNPRNEIDHQITVGDADELTREETDFESWHDFMNQALDDYWKSPRQNRRRHERHSCNIAVAVETGTEEIPGRMVDVSKSGFQVETNEKLPNTKIVRVQVPDEESHFDGDVVFRGAIRWTRDDAPYSMGVEILSKETY